MYCGQSFPYSMQAPNRLPQYLAKPLVGSSKVQCHISVAVRTNNQQRALTKTSYERQAPRFSSLPSQPPTRMARTTDAHGIQVFRVANIANQCILLLSNTTKYSYTAISPRLRRQATAPYRPAWRLGMKVLPIPSSLQSSISGALLCYACMLVSKPPNHHLGELLQDLPTSPV